MKNNLLVFILLLFSLASSAQFKIGPNAGIPVGDVSDFYKVSVGVDAYYMFGNSPDALLKFGAGTGFLYYGDEPTGGGGFKDASFIPLIGAARITLLNTIKVGPDIGYAFALDDLEMQEGKSGGFYYRLAAGIDIANLVELSAFYHSTSIGVNFSSVGLSALIEI